MSFAERQSATPRVAELPKVPSSQAESYLAVVAIIFVAIGLRPGIVATGPLLPAIIAEFSLSHAAASLLTAIPDVLMGLLALPTPWLARKFGRDRVLLTALVLLFLAMIGRAYAVDALALFSTTVGVGAGIAIAGTLMAGFIKGRFPAQTALVMGIYATALSFGSTVSAVATGPLSQVLAGGWRSALGVWGGLVLLGIAGWTAVATCGRRGRCVPPVALRVPLPLRNPTAWFIALFFSCDNLIFYALLTWIAPMYREAGLTASMAGLVLASFTAAFMFANPIFGWVSRSHDRRSWLFLCSLLAVAGLLLIVLAQRRMPLLGISICAFGLGGAFTLGMTLPLDNTKSIEEANIWTAFVLTVGYITASAGPLLVGELRDVTGTFRPAECLLIAVAAIMTGLAFLLRPQGPASIALELIPSG